MKLNSQETQLLKSLNKEQLIFLASIAEHKDYDILTEVANYFVDLEKNQFFKNTSYINEKLNADLAFSRGNVAGIVKLLHIMGGARAELNRREENK